MPRPAPTFRKHHTGVYFCRWGGKDHIFSKDKDASYKQYLDSLRDWAEWQAERKAVLARPFRKLTVKELSDQFLQSRFAEGGRDRQDFYAKHLRRFLSSHAGDRAETIRAVHLQHLKDYMLGQEKFRAARTINHDLQAVKTMLQWAMDLEYIPPVNLHGVKKLPLGEIPDKSWPIGKVRKYILGCKDENMRAWLAIHFLCAMRPKEVVRVMAGQGEWVQRGVLKIPNKAGQKVRLARHVLFSPEAFSWWRLGKPRWSRLDSFSAAVKREQSETSHPLRHSAGTILIESGVHREDADSILGHYPRAVSLVYMRMQWRRLRSLAARLTLKG